MRQALDPEAERKGPSEELDVLSRALSEKVIPRLLRPLGSGGRTANLHLFVEAFGTQIQGSTSTTSSLLSSKRAAFLRTTNAHSPTTQLGLPMLNSLNLKMSLASGDQLVIGLGMSTSLPTTHSPRFRCWKRISNAI
ncbi:hypothetical protein EDB80DRAFT_204534 [Ilyonectria destructans]|nr:hypothetical protein EDB80DRAFT_204534 [Ilyonectria destructans]